MPAQPTAAQERALKPCIGSESLGQPKLLREIVSTLLILTVGLPLGSSTLHTWPRLTQITDASFAGLAALGENSTPL